MSATSRYWDDQEPFGDDSEALVAKEDRKIKKKKLAVHAKPCESCPYRLDVPSGVWDRSEYEKLRLYDSNECLRLFLCHTDRKAVCRGWLAVHSESVAARLAVRRGEITDDERLSLTVVPLHLSGNAAADAGIAEVKNPGRRAIEMIEKLQEKMS